MTGLPQNPETYSVLGSFDGWSPEELAGKRLFGNDQDSLYVEFYGPISMRSVLDWHIAGHLEWADAAAKDRILSSARAELSAALEPRYRSVPDMQPAFARAAPGSPRRGLESSTPLGRAALIVRLSLTVMLMGMALAIWGQATHATQQAWLRLDEAERTSVAAQAEQDSRQQDYVAEALSNLPPAKDAWAERDFLRAARKRFRSDSAAMARIDQIQRVDRSSADVLDIYTMGYPPDLRPIVSATVPDVFAGKSFQVNIHDAINRQIMDRVKVYPETGTGTTSFQ